MKMVASLAARATASYISAAELTRTTLIAARGVTVIAPAITVTRAPRLSAASARAIKTGAVQARYVEVTKSSATPFANLAITFAVAGATTKRSTLCEKVIWAIGSGLSDE